MAERGRRAGSAAVFRVPVKVWGVPARKVFQAVIRPHETVSLPGEKCDPCVLGPPKGGVIQAKSGRARGVRDSADSGSHSVLRRQVNSSRLRQLPKMKATRTEKGTIKKLMTGLTRVKKRITSSKRAREVFY
jgi:hypothetical protein